MATVIVKHRLFTWFELTDNPVQPDGPKVWTERIAHLGDELEIPEDNPHLARGRQKDIDSFFSDEDAEKVRNGTYRGLGWEHVQRARAGIKPQSQIEPAEGEGYQLGSLTTEGLAEYISEHRLNVADTVALAGDDTESIEKVLDAENIASDNDPRKGVVEALEAKLSAVTQ